MKIKLLLLVMIFVHATAQVEGQLSANSSNRPELPQLFESKDPTREEFQELRKRSESKIREKISQGDALEVPIDAKEYIVGPGDLFTFNVWGPVESRKYIIVSPEGILSIPGVGEIDANRKSLKILQDSVLSVASKLYSNCRISLTLEALRFFRVHVVGEVKYPGTYLTQAINRVNELVETAGGPTTIAWTKRMEIKHVSGVIDTFDMAEFLLNGNQKGNIFLSGGDVVFIPALNLLNEYVRVDGSLEAGGFHQISPGEMLYQFCLRIRAMEKNSDLSKIAVVRGKNNQENQAIFYPFRDSVQNFELHSRDIIVLPSKYVYVKGAVRYPGAYPYVIDFTAKDYAGLAGGDFQSGGIRGVKVFRAVSGKIESGPNIVLSEGDVVDLPVSFGSRFQNYLNIISVFASLLIASKVVGNF